LFKQQYILLGLLIVLCVIMSLLSDRFLTFYNLFEITRYFVEIGLIALPMTLIIITGGVDLSVGSIVGLSVVVFGRMWRASGESLFAACAVTLLIGLFCGSINGLLIARLKVPLLIVTLATLAIFRGFALGISQAEPIHGYQESFFFLGQGYLGPIPTQFLVFVLAAALFAVGLSRTYWGRYIYAIGNNEPAVIYSGVGVQRIKLAVYSLSGLLCSLAAIIFVSRVSTAKADAGSGYELDAITAVVLGGTSIFGGRGSIGGTILGLVLITTLRNGLALARFSYELQSIFVGVLLLAAILLTNAFAQRR
jgi:rhamnose transport system permease protein